MAQYQHLPIYKQTYDILLRTMTATKDSPREYKFTLGQKIKDELIELVVMIYRANSAADKTRRPAHDRVQGMRKPAPANVNRQASAEDGRNSERRTSATSRCP